MTEAEFRLWLKNPTAARCVLVEVGVKTSGSETTRYLSTRGYVTESTETPANTYYMPVIVGGVKFSESISLDGSVSLAMGDIELNNMDGSLDSWLLDIWSNRTIKVFIGDVSWPRVDFWSVFDGIVTGIDSRKRDRINIKLSDKLQRLNNPVTEAKLGGATSNSDRLLPLCFGECHNIEPLLVDPSTHEYQVHQGAIERIIEVRDNGVPVAYTPFVSTGKFRLVNNPVGQITASIQGDVPAQNLLRYTQEFDNAAWTKTRSTCGASQTNVIAAPDGTLTAELVLVDATAANSHYVNRNLTGLVDNDVFSASVHVKQSMFERVMFSVVLKNGSTTELEFKFDETRMLRTSQGTGNTAVKHSWEDLGNGWYRLKMENINIGTGATTPAFRILGSRNIAITHGAWPNTASTDAVTADTPPVAGKVVASLVEDGTSSGHYVAKAENFVAGKTYTFDAWVKVLGVGATRYASLVFPSGTAWTTGTVGALFNLSTGAVLLTTGTGVSVSATSTDAGNGWWKISLTATAPGTGAASVQLRICNVTTQVAPSYAGDSTSGFLTCEPTTRCTDPQTGMGSTVAGSSFDGDGTSGMFYVWGAQFEQGSLARRYTVATSGDANIYLNTVTEIVKRLTTAYGNVTNRFTLADLDSASLGQFDFSNAQPVGIYLSDRANVLEVCNQLASSIGARLVVSATGLMSLVKLSLPQATAGTAVGSADMADRSLEISELPPVKAGVQLGYCKNWTVQAGLQTGVVAEHLAMYAEEWLTLTRIDSAASTDHKLFTEPVMEESLLLTAADALTEAQRRLDMWKTQRRVFKYKAFAGLLLEKLGNPQTITHSRFGLSGGVTGQIVKVTTDWINQRVELEVLA